MTRTAYDGLNVANDLLERHGYALAFPGDDAAEAFSRLLGAMADEFEARLAALEADR